MVRIVMYIIKTSVNTLSIRIDIIQSCELIPFWPSFQYLIMVSNKYYRSKNHKANDSTPFINDDKYAVNSSIRRC